LVRIGHNGGSTTFQGATTLNAVPVEIVGALSLGQPFRDFSISRVNTNISGSATEFINNGGDINLNAGSGTSSGNVILGESSDVYFFSDHTYVLGDVTVAQSLSSDDLETVVLNSGSVSAGDYLFLEAHLSVEIL